MNAGTVTKPLSKSVAVVCYGGTRHKTVHSIPRRMLQDQRKVVKSEPFVVQFTRPLPMGHVHVEAYELPPDADRQDLVEAHHIDVMPLCSHSSCPGAKKYRFYGGPADGEGGTVPPFEWLEIKQRFELSSVCDLFEVVELPGDELAICFLPDPFDITDYEKAELRLLLSGFHNTLGGDD